MTQSNASWAGDGPGPSNYKVADAYIIDFKPGAAASGHSFTPAVPVQAVEVMNGTAKWLRGNIKWASGITQGGADNFLVPPGKSVKVFDTSANAGDTNVGALDAITNVEIAQVDVTGNLDAVEPAAAMPLAASQAAGQVGVNFHRV